MGVEREPLPPLRPEDAPDAALLPQTEDQPGAYSGPYEAGGVWAVLDGRGRCGSSQSRRQRAEPAFATELRSRTRAPTR